MAVDPTAGGVHKTFKAEFEGRRVSVSHYRPHETENSADDNAAVELQLGAKIPLSFRIERSEMFYQKVADLFLSNETGHKPFDKAFKIETSSVDELNRLLTMPGGETSNFLNDLMITQKSYFRVVVTDGSVCLGRKTSLGDTETIRMTMKRAAYLAARLEDAAAAYAAK